jgi:S-DNA-T family DNA segregation ATPase FtsK/SpoIIIE
MELAAKDIRIEAPIPGRNAVGVEIPNVEMIPVRMAEMLKEIPPEKMNKKLLFALGRDLSGRPIFSELDKMPHLLIAGATGSGKSVCVNSIISTLLLRTTPDEVKMILIDPKKVEFTSFQKIPHLICPVISDASEAARALKIVVKMMENRYEVFSRCNVRNITAYNELLIKAPQEHLEPMPWIIVIIDELADLMIVAGKEVESSIQRITQLARAAGIHLIVATQRPSVDVITGIIKSNIPSRIAFAVSSGVDSRTILDHVGAERLLGYGDMLFIPVGEPASVRIQGVFVSDDEVRRLAETTAAQRKPTYDEAFINPEDGEGLSEGIASALDDPLFDEVKDYVIETQRASTSSIQRRFGLGYNRAARMMDVLEQKGIIGPTQGSKPRDVRVRKSDDED